MHPTDPSTTPDAPNSPPEPADTAPAADAPHPAEPDLAERIASVEAAAADLARRLEQAETARRIDRELLAGGVIDLDGARAGVEELLAAGSTVVQAVARLRERRPQLFAPRRSLRASALPAAGTSPDAPLHEIAAAARQTGDRRLLLDYLRLRRAGA